MQWGAVIEQLVRGLDRGSRHWTTARKKDSVQRVLGGSRSDAKRLRERLQHLLASWERDDEAASVEALAPAAPLPTRAAPGDASLRADLMASLRAGLSEDDSRARSLAGLVATQASRLELDGATPALVQAVAETAAEVRDAFARRHHLVAELSRLAREMTDSLTELAEDESWAEGQARSLREHLGDEQTAPSVRGVRAAGALLAQTRRAQQDLKAERDKARAALRTLVSSLMAELELLGGETGRFGDDLAQYAASLERAPDPAALPALLHDMLAKARSVQSEVGDASARLAAGQMQAQVLTTRVNELEGELKRLSEEVSTDALTQVSNRRGLQQAFEVEAARSERDGSSLAVGLIDLDNFKKLNDSLGHAAGDTALKTLATQVRTMLRPVDHVARYGGEEFVVLLPAIALDAARDALMRLQRSLSMSLFLHEGREVFVTFSAGVTLRRSGEDLDAVVERADAALYEAKRAGKNRTCAA
jgi:diguanylate cyclase